MSKLGQLSSVERNKIKLNPVLYEHIAPDSKIKFILFWNLLSHFFVI